MTRFDRPEYLATIADFAANARLETLGTAALERTRWIIADCIPVIAAGMQEPEMKALVATRLKKELTGNAWVLGTGRRAAAGDAALLNGTAGTWLELDEGNLFAKGHPGIQVVPAAIAAAQERHASGAALLLAVALGYEISARISHASDMRLSLHPHGTYGVMGAAIAVAKLKHFTAAQMLEVLNVSATMGMATSRQTLLDGATVRNIYAGHSALMGSMATELVECGFTGEVDAVSTIYGKVLSDSFDSARVVQELGSEWLLTKSYFKLHPTGRYVHSAIDALEDLLSRVPGNRLDPGQVERIDVRAYKLAAMLAEKRVQTSFGARFSVPFALASIIVHGRSGLESFSAAAVANPAVQALAQHVDLHEDSTFNARYPAEQLVDVHVDLGDGTSYEGHCLVTKGEPTKPHTVAELTAKFVDLGEPIWGRTTTDRLFHELMQLETIVDVSQLVGDVPL